MENQEKGTLDANCKDSPGGSAQVYRKKPLGNRLSLESNRVGLGIALSVIVKLRLWKPASTGVLSDTKNLGEVDEAIFG